MAKDKRNRKNALGRGLSALLDDNDLSGFPIGTGNAAGGSVSEIKISHIETNPFQPRIEFAPEALQELSDSIQAQGLIQPITVRKMGHNAYQLISGERRLRASKLAGRTTIPTYVRTAGDEQMLEMALIENIQREDLNPMEIALGYERLLSELKLTLEALGEKVGKKRATVNNYLRLLKLPPQIQMGLKAGKIGMGHARALISLPNTVDQLAIFKEIQEKDLSVRAVEEIVRKLNQKSGKKSSSNKSHKSEFLVALERTMEEKFGNRVLLNQQNSGKGEIKITFDSTEDLNRILEILNP